MSVYPIVNILDDAVEAVDVFTELKNALRAGGQPLWDDLEPWLIGTKTEGHPIRDGAHALNLVIVYDKEERSGALLHIISSGVMKPFELQKVLRRVLRRLDFTLKGDRITGRKAITDESPQISSED